MVTKTARIVELMRIYETRGFWSRDEAREAREIVDMGRDASYMPEGTEDWMQEDGVPRSYDRPKVPNVPKVLSEMRDEALAPKINPPPPRPSEPKELAKYGLTAEEARGPVKVMGITEAEAQALLASDDARIKTLEATMTDVVRRLKALEERVIDPSV